MYTYICVYLCLYMYICVYVSVSCIYTHRHTYILHIIYIFKFLKLGDFI